MVTHEVDPQPETYADASFRWLRRSEPMRCSPRNASGSFRFLFCRFSACPAPVVVAAVFFFPAADSRLLPNLAPCCCFPAGCWECIWKTAQVGAQAIDAKSRPAHRPRFPEASDHWLICSGRNSFSVGRVVVLAPRSSPGETVVAGPELHPWFLCAGVFAVLDLGEARETGGDSNQAGLVGPGHASVCADSALIWARSSRDFSSTVYRSCFLSRASWFFSRDGNTWRRFRFRWRFWS